MSELNISILKQNVRNLIKENGMTQEQLGQILGMSQPNLSKALNDNDKKCFTISQVYGIAEHFGVTIDWLLGHKQDPVSLNQRSVAEFIAKLLKLRIARSCEITLTEHVITPEVGPLPSKSYDQATDYLAFYFPRYWLPDDLTTEVAKNIELSIESEKHGNHTLNWPLNDFLEAHQKVVNLYHENQLQEEHYEIILKDYLSKLSTDSLHGPVQSYE